jgi:hypothetical protein
MNYGNGASTMTLSPEASQQKKQSNIVGLIALIAAVLGFIFACIPGALIIGWILLPIAFIMSLVSLFLKGKSKWMGVTALILSIVGTIVGVIVFVSVVADSVDEALGSGDTTVVQPSDNAEAPKEAAQEQSAPAEASKDEEGTRANPYPIGSVIENDEWRVVVNSVTLAATDAVLAANQFNEPPAEGSEHILVNYSVTYVGDDANGQMPAFVSLEYVTADGTTVNTFDSMAVAPEAIDSTSTLYTDGTATGNITFAVPTATAGQGVLAVRAGMLGDKIFVAVQ